MENRTRLLLEVVEAVTSVWGAGRVGLHISPGLIGAVADQKPPTEVAERINSQKLEPAASASREASARLPGKKKQDYQRRKELEEAPVVD